MSLEEMKQKAIELINKLTNKEKLEKVLLVLSIKENQFTADEVFRRSVSKFDAALQKLAD